MKYTTAIALAAIFVTAPVVLADDVQPLPPPVEAAPAPAATPATAPVPAPPVEQVKPTPPPVPAVTPDSEIFRRTPKIDGQIDPGEWDKFYSFEYNGVRGTAYIDWDDRNLYVASRTSAPSDLLIILDGAADGWFHGSDNFEITAKRAVGDGAPTLTVSRYQSKGKPGAPAAPLVAAESSMFVMKAASAPDSNVYEIAIPISAVPGLDLKLDRQIGLKVAVGVGSPEVTWIPTAPFGEVQMASFVCAKSNSLVPLKVDVEVRDPRLVPGDELNARITFRNTSEVYARIDTIIVGGEGKTAKLLGSELLRLDGIAPGKSYTAMFKSALGKTATIGSAAMGVEARWGEERVASSLVSFDVVSAYEVGIDCSVQGKTGERRVIVTVKNNTKKSAYGKVKLSLPEGWQVRHSVVDKEFFLRDEDASTEVVYRVTPPAGAKGRVPALAEVQIGGQTISVSGVVDAQ